MFLGFLVTTLILTCLPYCQCGDRCDDCKDTDLFKAWGQWSPCSPKNSDACHKVQTRIRSRGLFFCDYCRTETRERRCQQCEQQCSIGVCSCDDGYKLNTDQLGCSLLPCSSLNVGNCPSNSYKDNNGDACRNVNKICTNADWYKSKCTLNCPPGYGLAVIASTANSKQYFAEFLSGSDFLSVSKDTTCTLDAKKQLVWDVDTSNYYCRRLNDAPRYLNLSNLNIDEHLPVNSLVGNISSYDENDVVYTIESSQGSNYFNILGNKLRTSKSFSWKDFTNPTVSLLLKAMDKTSPSYYTTKSFDIEIINVDDAPKNVELSNTNFNDLTEVGQVIGNLTAEDIDKKPPQRSSSYHWTLLPQGPYYQHFKIVGNALILTKHSNKNEDFSPYVRIRCTENTKNAKVTEKTFTLFHYNSNNPVNIQFADIDHLPESTPVNSTVGKINIIDDEGDLVKIHDQSESKAKAKFTFTDLECVKENGKTNCSSNIVLTAPLDYEQDTEYNIAVEAVDEHNEKSYLSTKLKITNVNERPTRISFDKAILSVPEGSFKRYLVGTINVADEDFNVKGCSITKQSPFEISTFSILVKDDNSLDFERKNSYTVNIRCVDEGGLAIEKQTQILVTDVNEEPGNPCTSVTNIEHQTSVDTKIATLNAVDSDNEVYAKQTISFQVVSVNVPFVVNGNKMVVNGDLQPAHHYTVDVKVSDDGVLMKHTQNGGLQTYTGTLAEKVYQCIIKTSDPCDEYHEYKNGLCQCKGQLTGSKCDRDPTRCASNNCGSTSLCSTFVKSPVLCVEKNFQIPMLLAISSNKFADEKFRNNLEEYIESILEGNASGKSLNNLEGNNKRKRRSTGEDFYVQIGEHSSIKSVYTYVRFIPFKESSSSYILTSNSALCPKFHGTDVRCLNAQDCEILKSAGITCGPNDGKQTNTGASVNGNTEESSGPAIYTYLVPIAVAVIITIVILFLLYRRRNRPAKEFFPDEPVVFNNQTNVVISNQMNNSSAYQRPVPRKPLNTDQSTHGQTMSDIERNRRLTDLNQFDSRVFEQHNAGRFECENPAYGIQRPIDPNTVNYRENRAYIEDVESKNLTPPNTANPLYASKDECNAHVVDLVEEQRAKEKEYAIIDDVTDPALKQIRRGANLNLFSPEKDDDKDDKMFKKLTIGDDSET